MTENKRQTNKSHQPSGRQVVSGLRVSIHPFNSYNSLYCTGGGVQPSSYLLPWTQNGGAKCTRSHLCPIFSLSWSSSFFHHFFNTILYRFWLHFGPQLGPKIAPKSIKNRSQERSGKHPTFFIDFCQNFNGFRVRRNLVFRLPVRTGSKNSRFRLSAFKLYFY